MKLHMTQTRKGITEIHCIGVRDFMRMNAHGLRIESVELDFDDMSEMARMTCYGDLIHKLAYLIHPRMDR